MTDNRDDEEQTESKLGRAMQRLEDYHPSRIVAWLGQRLFIFEQLPPIETTPEDGGRDLYETLEVSPEANTAQIRRAYRQQALVTHPDKPTGDAEQFRRVAYAYNTLSDLPKRAEYDRRRVTGTRPSTKQRRLLMRVRPFRDIVGILAEDLANAGETLYYTLAGLSHYSKYG
eukprot:CAMPEP_0172677910 /NCGR_PEP_ID=MMETSP1074-20121228/15004_1 /TAXON_ID=2916 /ORGANISM="Ceratium fusus, Strain PA161109" /LENGTH=171 /DNA_ID=CAMNT_0013495829 /DNA_START=104 /DNA_END=616 /DNA_ORIENTATION=-